jgi:hypothetical protein
MSSSSESRSLRAKRRAVDRSHEAAITHLAVCVTHRDQCELDLKNFRLEHPNERVINANPILKSRHLLLMTAKNKAWEAYFKAHKAANPKTIEDILWIMAKAGHTQLVAPLMNLSKVTRTCIHLQPIMMNVKLGERGRTQLHHCVENGLTTSVKRLLSIRNINVNVKDDVSGSTPLHWAARNGHIEIARLLLQNGADVNAKDTSWDRTPLHWAAIHGHVDILHLLVENGADLEAQDDGGSRALHWAAYFGRLPLIQELISRYHVDINARDNDGRTALSRARLVILALQSLPSFNQMAVYRVMIYPYLILNPLHISLIIQFIIINVKIDYTKVKKSHQTQIKSFFTQTNSILHIQSYSLSFVCLSNLYNLKKELIILVLVLKKIQTVLFWIQNVIRVSTSCFSFCCSSSSSFYSPLDIS